ncbi:beta-lactamase family protein [Mycobacterium sp. CBMA293]|uniref:serine hydrolase domain-containing protein n=2 Tax=Mycolicibacterium TaxID=1866885 RepID=UPI0012DC30E0|nr:MULTISPECIES: serine hydrolase domain-containing protein [unclassified Mycolicibacterium]MUL49939.1 beta-lactamase family protein [Mycolicibacterium sp. CBMA 360]MUL57711.1 beta-lactamase family protein [Mycolicibacterium sp. CBMA 335]MUL72840.1 beta-lactamase family protein [Mycolicibacterium sp. CBMA 311]MUL96790.1 beta-lactamase family protein [Mycolicibacterium sp. CBMA 230]MUM07143.1 serine hydrolase [Mycolicibacterium sp. CBMA 213]
MTHRPAAVTAFKLRYLARKVFAPGRPASLADIGLFTGAPQHENFVRIDELAPVRRMPPSTRPFTWPAGPPISLPASYVFDSRTKSTEQFLVDTDTAALLVIVDGRLRYERYLLTGGPTVNWLSMSVAKSFISALVGIAVAEGHIADIDDAISDYVPVDAGSAYDGVSIRNVLQMSSGARWNEDYNDPSSDVHQLTQAMMGRRGGLDGFVARMSAESAPGTVCRYNSGETQILGALIAHAVGTSVSEYMTDKLVEPLGFESPSFWVTDLLGTEMSYAGLNLTARDYARLGELYRNNGMWQGRQIVSTEWARASTTIDSQVREAGQPIVGDHAIDLGYGYQWWIPAGDKGDFSAIGVLNQLVYVNPGMATTIVKLSANRRYGTSPSEATNRDLENVEFLRAIAASVG